MSDNTDTTDGGASDSLFSNFKNKFKYNLHKAAYDPNANKFANEQAKKKKDEEEAKKKTVSDTTTTDTTEVTQGDPDKFNAKRLAKKVGNQTLDILKKIFFPFVGLMLAMIVANELIIYAPPIRIIFFIFTLAICIHSQTIAILLSIYYILKGGYSFYINHMTDKPNKYLMPTIFALLPITTFKPMSSFVGFFLYPFTYPKTEAAAQVLPDIMANYWKDLVGSFKDYDKVKNLPIFVEDVKSIKYNLAHLHNLSDQVMNLKNDIMNQNKNTTEKVNINIKSNQVTTSVEKVNNKSNQATINDPQTVTNTEKVNNKSNQATNNTKNQAITNNKVEEVINNKVEQITNNNKVEKVTNNKVEQLNNIQKVEEQPASNSK
jgi:hypothetical protein